MEEVPDYEALSYYWGDTANPICIYSSKEYIEGGYLKLNGSSSY
jgi:hypothetical protein